MENRFAAASLVLGIVGVLYSMFALLSLPINIVGLVLGILSKRIVYQTVWLQQG